MMLVLDASMALSWLFQRTDPQEAARSDQLLTAIIDAQTLVPTIWHLEIANALLVGERRGVATEAQVIDYLSRLYRLPIITEEDVPAAGNLMTMALAREHGLSAHDAAYLDLALRNNAALATFDAKLAAAMKRAGGALL